MKEVICCIFCILSCVGLFIWAGCNSDISSYMKRQEIQYRMNNYRNVVIVDKHYDWDLLSDDWYISVKYDGTVRVIEVTKETAKAENTTAKAKAKLIIFLIYNPPIS